jgi:hypothetical protein
MSDFGGIVLLVLLIVVALMALRGRLGRFTLKLPGAGAEVTSRSETKIRAIGSSVVENTNNNYGNMDLEAKDTSRISRTSNNQKP